MYVVENPILNDAKCVIQPAFPPYTVVDYRSFRLYVCCIAAADIVVDTRQVVPDRSLPAYPVVSA